MYGCYKIIKLLLRQFIKRKLNYYTALALRDDRPHSQKNHLSNGKQLPRTGANWRRKNIATGCTTNGESNSPWIQRSRSIPIINPTSLANPFMSLYAEYYYPKCMAELTRKKKCHELHLYNYKGIPSGYLMFKFLHKIKCVHYTESCE